MTIRFRHQEKDVDGRSFDEAMDRAKEWVDRAPELARFVPDVASKAKAADRRYGYFRPDDVFVVETGNLEEADRKKIADRILDKADDPYVSVSVGRLTVAPSRNSYFGDELFVAVKEAIRRPNRFEPKGNRFVLI